MIKKNEPYIIGETAFHHQGDINYLKELIDRAAEMELDAIKFHLLFDVEDYFVAAHPAFETVKQWMFTAEKWSEIIEYAHKKGLDIITLCNDVASLKWINNECRTPIKAVELHATGINDMFLLKEASGFENTVMLGVGGSSLDQVHFAVKTLKDQEKSDIFLMYGFQNYPTDYRDINFNKMSVIQKIFDLPVGYADHTDPSDPNNEFITASAVLKGINVIEKHFTLDPDEKRIDSQAAVSLAQMKSIKQLCHTMFQVNGPGGIEMSVAEKKYGDTGPMKKAIVARKAIKEGQAVQLDDLAYKRTPQSSYLDQSSILSLIDSKALTDIEQDELITYSNVEYQFNVPDNSQFFIHKQ